MENTLTNIIYTNAKLMILLLNTCPTALIIEEVTNLIFFGRDNAAVIIIIKCKSLFKL